MLSEIFILKLEAAKRGAAEESRIPNARFVPLAPALCPRRLLRPPLGRALHHASTRNGHRVAFRFGRSTKKYFRKSSQETG